MTYVYIGTKILESKCHQHIEEFACRSLYPECEQLDVMYPCRSMCYEVLSACGPIFDSFPVLDCRAYPVRGNGTLCFSKPVECPLPENPHHGIVHYNSIYLRGRATYTCDEKYTLVGENIRVCMANGTWSGSKPFCELFKQPYCLPSPTTLLLVATSIVSAVVLIILVLFRPYIELMFCPSNLFGDSFFWKKNEDPSKVHDAFVLFHECDEEWVVSEIVNQLDTHYKVIYRERDYPLGKLVNEFIEYAVSSSNVGIVVVSQNFTKCNFELYNFTLAKHEHIRKDNFRVISVVKPNTFDLSPRIESLMRFTVRLDFDNSPKFWEKLHRLMPKRRMRLFNKQISLDNTTNRSTYDIKSHALNVNNRSTVHRVGVTSGTNNDNNNNVTSPSPLDGYPTRIYYI